MSDDVGIAELDEHVVDFCFGLGMALRRVLELDVSEEEYEEDDMWDELLTQVRELSEEDAA
jgi:hypothetical protein